MFCNHCGAQLAEGTNYCPKCGKSQLPAANVQMKPLCPKCGKDLVLSQPDGSPLLDGYVHMECSSCGDNVRYTVLRSSIPDTTLNIANVQKQHVSKKLFKFFIPIAITFIVCGLAMAILYFTDSLDKVTLIAIAVTAVIMFIVITTNNLRRKNSHQKLATATPSPPVAGSPPPDAKREKPWLLRHGWWIMILVVLFIMWQADQRGGGDAGIISFFNDLSCSAPSGGTGGSTSGGGISGGMGTLSVSSNGGDVYVNGQFLCRGSGSISLQPGTYRVTCNSASTGKLIWQTSINIVSGKTSTVNNNTWAR